VIALVAIGLGCSAAHAQGKADRARRAGDHRARLRGDRELGADHGRLPRRRRLARELLPIIRKRNLEQPPETLAFMVREAKRVYEKAHMSADELGADAFERCALGLVKVPQQ
jgi:hypothetical protein